MTDTYAEEVSIDARRAHDRLERNFDFSNQAAVQSGAAALRACLLVNGGAILALLTFMGPLLEKRQPGLDIGAIAHALSLFGWGVASAAAAHAGAYFVNYYRASAIAEIEYLAVPPFARETTGQQRENRIANVFQGGTILLAVFSLGLLMYGIWTVGRAMEISAPTAAVTKPCPADATPPPLDNQAQP